MEVCYECQKEIKEDKGYVILFPYVDILLCEKCSEEKGSKYVENAKECNQHIIDSPKEF